MSVVRDLHEMQERLGKLTPELKVGWVWVFTPEELEDIATAFTDNGPIFCCPPILLKAGLILPRNTLIIHRADMFGLSALYQLR